METPALNACTGWETAIRCHPGLQREVNEDAYIARPDLCLWAVADGMGGHARGDYASRSIVEALDALPATPEPDRAERVIAALQAAHHRIQEKSREIHEPVGSTVVAFVAMGGAAEALWVGDSRLYRLREGVLEQLSHDHSMVQEWIDQGMVRPEEAEQLPNANVITRAVGMDESLQIDRRRFEVAAGDLFLLCSDGLTRELADEELAAILSGSPSLESAADRLLEAVLARGAHDNVTLILLRCCKS